MGLLSRLRDWLRPKPNVFDEVWAKVSQEMEAYRNLRQQFQREGVYENVIVEVLPYGTLPAYDCDPGAEIVTFDDTGAPITYTQSTHRLWVGLREVPYRLEGYHIGILRELMPDADEYRVVLEHSGLQPRRGYWAVRYPKETA